MKAATKAWYWLAAGVLALGLNGYYQDGGLQWLHRLDENASTALAESRTQFHEIATLAEVAMAGHVGCRRQVPVRMVLYSPMVPPHAEAGLAGIQERVVIAESARVEARMARLRQLMAQREMQGALVKVQNGRLSVLTDQGQVQVALPPPPRVEVNVPQGPVVDVSESN